MIGKAMMRVVSSLNTLVYRGSGGRLMGRFPSGAPVCLLTTTGRRSGRRRTVPLLFLSEGDDLIVVASQGGAPRHPGWYLNLRANREAEVELGRRRVAVEARDLDGAERDRLWPRLVAMYPPYEAYRQRTTRVIPLVRLRPRQGGMS